ncbi:MAG: putative baseplate assembly protein [Synechococcales bacterium]|nr:putative baseplate assembly protein [Synechococcales bacterium]
MLRSPSNSQSSSPHYSASHEQRRILVRERLDDAGNPILNGIDYLEVASDRHTIFVYFIHPITIPITLENIYISRAAENRSAAEQPADSSEVLVQSLSFFEKRLTLGVQPPADSLPYCLSLIQHLTDETTPLAGIDTKLAQVEFVFQAGGMSEFDCQVSPDPAPPLPPAPTIDYLAKDYSSFRQLMLDRLAVTLPQWKERSPADLGMVMVELLAYAGDYLSYYQDAVATEAYLGTARKRMSVRRHARLLNYRMHDGCNSRVWVSLTVSAAANGTVLPGPSAFPPRRGQSFRSGLRFLSRIRELPPVLNRVQFNAAIDREVLIFETLHDLVLHSACNRLEIYTWGEQDYILPIGTTQATLKDPEAVLSQHLKPGMVLILEEVGIYQAEVRIDPDINHRHAILLTKITPGYDPLLETKYVEIEWAIEDALPFELTIALVINHQPYANFTVALGNVVLADHGRTVEHEDDRRLDPIPDGGRYRPRLLQRNLTQQGQVQRFTGERVPVNLNPLRDRPDPLQPDSAPHLDPQVSAKQALQWDLQQVMPAIFLEEFDRHHTFTSHWVVRRDLLNSDRFARDFVAETEEDHRVYLRFGDGELGRIPPADKTLKAIYRVGNGTAGNVGADAIAHIFTEQPEFMNILTVRNPLPASGGCDPESMEQVKLYAPQAFRTLQRAVTEADYAQLTEQFPSVTRALATRRWTGSWYTMFITVDRQGGLPIDDAFKQDLKAFLEPFRLTGHDLEIESPRFVALDIAITVQILPTYFASQVTQALQLAFSNQRLPNGILGFFHPDRFTFGQPVYLSQVIERAMQIAGVQSVSVTRFQRWGLPSQQELELGRISFRRLEIARLDNDATRPGSGKLELKIQGGL